jgi:hypothetical protein
MIALTMRLCEGLTDQGHKPRSLGGIVDNAVLTPLVTHDRRHCGQRKQIARAEWLKIQTSTSSRGHSREMEELITWSGVGIYAAQLDRCRGT